MMIIKKVAVILISALLLFSYAQADAIQVKESTLSNSNTTTTDILNFRIEVEAGKGINAHELLSGVSFDAGTIDEVTKAVDKARKALHPNDAIKLSITRKPEAVIEPKVVSGYISLYTAKLWWNQAVYYGGAVYAYNYYVNTVACFMDVTAGSWNQQVQDNGAWINVGTYSAVGAMTRTGYDNYKGCWYKGMSSYNKANIVMYFYT